MTRHWLIPQEQRPKLHAHPVMWPTRSAIAPRGSGIGSSSEHLGPSRVVKTLKSRLAFLLISKLYRQMYANTGIATDSARVSRGPVGAIDGEAVPSPVRGPSHARLAVALT